MLSSQIQIFGLLAGTPLFPSIEDPLISSAQWVYAYMLAFCRLPDESEEELNAYFSRGTRAAELFPSGERATCIFNAEANALSVRSRHEASGSGS